jgi:hypothetical protein
MTIACADGENIDVFLTAFEGVFAPTRFNELFEKLMMSKNQADSSFG